jgi:hypothetical protein
MELHESSSTRQDGRVCNSTRVKIPVFGDDTGIILGQVTTHFRSYVLVDVFPSCDTQVLYEVAHMWFSLMTDCMFISED